jgi:alkylation response protein AidB-like acyl-CoA dehydrogenase
MAIVAEPQPVATDPVSALQIATSIASALSERAIASDREGGAPFEEIALLRSAGLFKLLVPTSLGGLGGGWADALKIARVFARVNGSIGQLIGYHYLNSVTPRIAGTPEQARRFEVGLAKGGWFVGDSVNPLDPALTVARKGEGFVLDGHKTFSTGAFVSDQIILAFFIDGLLVFAAIPRDRTGLKPNDDFDFIGLRQSVSGTVDFDGVEVYGDEVIGPGPRDPASLSPAANLLAPLIQGVFVNLYLGVAEGALAAAADYTRHHARAWFKAGVTAATDDPHVQARYGELVSSLDAALALADQLGDKQQAALARGEDLTAEERAIVATETFKAKVVSTKTALELTSAIFELTGARSTARKFGFDRFWRDVRTHTLHDPVVYKAQEVGAYFLTGAHPLPTLYS